MTSMRVGFVGLDRTASRVAADLIRAGHHVSVFDRDDVAVARLVDLGGDASIDPAVCADGAEIVVTTLDASDGHALLTGPVGITKTVDGDALVVDLSTAHPLDSDRIREAIAPTAFVDAPVAGTPDPAGADRLVVFAGGTPAQIERLRPFFDCFAADVVDCGGPGRGVRARTVHVALSIAVAALSAEAVTLAERLGVETARALDVIRYTPAGVDPTTTSWRSDAPAADPAPGVALDVAARHLAVALDIAGELGVPTPAISGAHEDVERAMAHGGGDGGSWSALLDGLRVLDAG